MAENSFLGLSQQQRQLSIFEAEISESDTDADRSKTATQESNTSSTADESSVSPDTAQAQQSKRPLQQLQQQQQSSGSTINYASTSAGVTLKKTKSGSVRGPGLGRSASRSQIATKTTHLQQQAAGKAAPVPAEFTTTSDPESERHDDNEPEMSVPASRESSRGSVTQSSPAPQPIAPVSVSIARHAERSKPNAKSSQTARKTTNLTERKTTQASGGSSNKRKQSHPHRREDMQFAEALLKEVAASQQQPSTSGSRGGGGVRRNVGGNAVAGRRANQLQSAQSSQQNMLHRQRGRDGASLPKKKKPKKKGIANVVRLRDLRKEMNKPPKMVIPLRIFTRCVRELCPEAMDGGSFRFQKEALTALQEAAEYYLMTVFEDVNMLAVHAKRVTIMPKDVTLAMTLIRRHREQVGLKG
ncbi:hypothetical protein BV898_03941 [Hypsibius exemplaris]|uniref:Core Histone H2A/H2B/H3 domain-containing protein n=1 Tax=Hypsibius exemplaris TaxID=2072580 RepID=A0A1W0X3M9_HYPEX|nr:hypothetical protein BV898_03941 [Hypsibius exemplaris]